MCRLLKCQEYDDASINMQSRKSQLKKINVVIIKGCHRYNSIDIFSSCNNEKIIIIYFHNILFCVANDMLWHFQLSRYYKTLNHK